jgi:hypothetical protein
MHVHIRTIKGRFDRELEVGCSEIDDQVRNLPMGQNKAGGEPAPVHTIDLATVGPIASK